MKVSRICNKRGYKGYIFKNFFGNTSARNMKKYLILMAGELHKTCCLEFPERF